MSISGVFKARKKDGTEYFRASITHKGKHISLGSFETIEAAGAAYAVAKKVLEGGTEYSPDDYERVVADIKVKKVKKAAEKIKSRAEDSDFLKFDKWIMLLNTIKTGMYCKNPIYLYGKYFVYFLDRDTELKFDADELFFYRNHKLMRRGGHIFYSDFGMQSSLLTRYGVKSFSVEGRDYIFKNGDRLDFRYGNLSIINKFYGVSEKIEKGIKKYFVKIHVRGSVSVGCYSSDVEAAVAYNKAADSLEEVFRRKKNEGAETAKSTIVENKMLGNLDLKSTNYTKNEKEENLSTDYGCRINDDKYATGNAEHKDMKSGGKDHKKHIKTYRKWRRNFIEGLTGKAYVSTYEQVKFSKSFKRYLENL